MTVIHACDYGLIPDKDITRELATLLSNVKDFDGEKTSRFLKKALITSTAKNAKSIR